MKMSQARYDLLKTAMRAVADFHGPQQFRDYAAEKAKTIGVERGNRQMMWLLHRKATEQLQYPDSHPFYVNGTWERCYPHHDGFDNYLDGDTRLHDSHIETAIKRIVKELGLTINEAAPSTTPA